MQLETPQISGSMAMNLRFGCYNTDIQIPMFLSGSNHLALRYLFPIKCMLDTVWPLVCIKYVTTKW
jgi:hypothetical protein